QRCEHCRSYRQGHTPCNNQTLTNISVVRPPDIELTRCYPRHFTFHVADRISSIASSSHCKHLPEMIPGFGAGLVIPDLWQQEAVRALQQGKDVVVQAPTGSGKTYIFELLYPN